MKLEFAKAGILDTLLDMLTARTASWTSQSAPKIEEFDAVRVSIDLLVLLLTGGRLIKIVLLLVPKKTIVIVYQIYISLFIHYMHRNYLFIS